MESNFADVFNQIIMKKENAKKHQSQGLGGLINSIQTMFVGLLRIWSIPIVLMLSFSSGFTTFYGMSHFILPWIALIITIAIQSIIVICSLEIAGIHWKANRYRYFSVFASLLIAIVASVSFSYFKFYEISEEQNVRINRLQSVREVVDDYLRELIVIKTDILDEQRLALEQASTEVTQAYFGTHPITPQRLKNQVGEGPLWKHYNQLYLEKKEYFQYFDQGVSTLDGIIRNLQTNLNQLDNDSNDIEDVYQRVLTESQDLQIKFNELASKVGRQVPRAPKLMAYVQFVQGFQPSFAMWKGFSWFAFICAAMVDFFTVLLSYRLEFTAPGPLNEREQELVFECLRQFNEFRINENDELEMIIEKTEIERARRYSDWARMFAVGFLLSRGFLIKIDHRTVEFAPNLYPLIAERMGEKLQQIKQQSLPSEEQSKPGVSHEQS
jgi:hypothetical protein